MDRLTTPAHWEAKQQAIGTHRPSWKDRIRTSLGAEPGESYKDFQVSRCIAETLPYNPTWQAIELGCAPGRYILRMHRDLGYEPWGVDYTTTGVVRTEEQFITHGQPREHVIFADVLDDSFQAQFEGGFDVVMSRGLVEHFEDTEPILRAHLRLLRPDGWLVIGIPNMYSFSYRHLQKHAPEVLTAHNLRLMEDPLAFLQMFSPVAHILREVHIKHLGTWQWYGPGSKTRWNSLVHHALFALLRGRDIRTRWAPYYLAIARKATAK